MKKEIVKKMNQIEKKIERRYELIGQLEQFRKLIELRIDKHHKEILIFEKKIKKLATNHKKLHRKFLKK